MSIEKQIAEMARGMCLLSARLKCSECSDKCQYYDFAERLYKNGYRKASDVVAEIFAEIETAFARVGILPHNVGLVDFNVIAELKKKYTESEGE